MKKKRRDAFLYRESISKIIRVMKLVSFFLLAGFLQVAANVYSQNANIRLSMQDARLNEVIKAIQQQTEFTFFYSPDDIRDVVVSKVELEKASLETTLDLCLKGTNLEYEIVRKAVILKKGKDRNAGLPDFSTLQQPQKKEISGSVKDSKGLSLPGVSVVVKGSTTGTVTDPNGQFILSASSDARILVFSFVGMKSQEIELGGKNRFDVVLEEEAFGVDEVVVVGYGTQKKANLTGSVQNITSRDLVKRSASNTSVALQGLAPGVSVVTSSGRPGYDGAGITIRGTGSLNSSTSPLVLIDGVEGYMNFIDINTIESISVLKDAASASIYGSRASNGVILVTTKRSKEQPLKVSYNGYVGYNTPTQLPDPVNAIEYMEAINLANANAGANQTYSDDLINQYKTSGADNLNRYETNWRKEIIKDNALTHNHSVSLSGGSKDISVFANAAY